MVMEFLNAAYFGNRLLDYILFLAIIGVSIVLGKGVYYVVRNILKKWAEKSETKLDDILIEVLDHPLVFLIFIVGLSIGYRTLTLSEGTAGFFNNLVSILLIVDIAWFIIKLVDRVLIYYIVPLTSKTETELDDVILPIVRKLARYGLIIIAAIMVLDKFGYNITSLVAGLGIGGLAVALAAKDMLGNMFGGASILTDKPFKIGDRIRFDKVDGYVKELGLRSTKVSALDGAEIIVPNAKLADNIVENVTREKGRRIKLSLGLTYNTSNFKLKKACQLIKKVLEDHKHVGTEGFMKPDVFFDEFGAYSLNLTVIYWIQQLDKINHTKNEINFAIKKAFEEEGIEFAFPTQTIEMKQGAAETSEKQKRKKR